MPLQSCTVTRAGLGRATRNIRAAKGAASQRSNRQRNSACLIWSLARNWVDLHRRGRTGDQANADRHIMNSNPHRHALGEPDPRENWTDIRKPLVVWLCIWDIDAPCNAADLAFNDLAVSQQFDLSWIAFTNGGKLRFLEIGIHPKGISIDEGDHTPPYGRIVT